MRDATVFFSQLQVPNQCGACYRLLAGAGLRWVGAGGNSGRAAPFGESTVCQGVTQPHRVHTEESIENKHLKFALRSLL